MFQDAAVFLFIALVAALCGFIGITAGAAGIAQLLVPVLVVCTVVALVIGIVRGA